MIHQHTQEADAVFRHRAPIDANVEAQLDHLKRLLERATVRVYDATETRFALWQSRMVLVDDLHKVCVCLGVSRVQKKRQVKACGELELRRKVSAGASVSLALRGCKQLAHLSCVSFGHKNNLS